MEEFVLRREYKILYHLPGHGRVFFFFSMKTICCSGFKFCIQLAEVLKTVQDGREACVAPQIAASWVYKKNDNEGHLPAIVVRIRPRLNMQTESLSRSRSIAFSCRVEIHTKGRYADHQVRCLPAEIVAV